MRMAVLADIHGNLPALEAVLNDCQRSEPIEAYLVAGDLLSRAPFPLEVMTVLQSLRAQMVMGNGDQYQVEYADDPYAGPGQAARWGIVR